MGKARRILRQRRDEVSGLLCCFSVAFTDRDDATNTRQADPTRMAFLQPFYGVTPGVGPGLNPTLIAINSL